jgi:DNA-binding GntR family transcriptional regulator
LSTIIDAGERNLIKTPKAGRDGASSSPFGSKVTSDGALKTSLVQQVYDEVMAELDRGELRPGQRIVASEIAKVLQVSRAPVREALAVLAGRGVVELLPDRGAILRPMSRTDLSSVYEIVAPIAAVGVKAAARRIDEGDNRQVVEAAMEAIRQGAGLRPYIQFFLRLNDYHFQLNAMGDNAYVDVLLRTINLEYWNRLLIEAIDMDVHAKGYIANYERLTSAVLAGDEGSVEAVLLYHAQWCIELIETGRYGQ